MPMKSERGGHSQSPPFVVLIGIFKVLWGSALGLRPAPGGQSDADWTYPVISVHVIGGLRGACVCVELCIMPRSPSIVPDDTRRDVYLVLDDFGSLGRVWRE